MVGLQREFKTGNTFGFNGEQLINTSTLITPN